MSDAFDTGFEVMESHGERGHVVHLPLRPTDRKRLAARRTLGVLTQQAELWALLAACAAGGDGEVAERAMRITGDLAWVQQRIEAELVRLAEQPATGTA